MIRIVDYGMGNLGSVKNMLKKVGFDSEVTNDPQEILSADKIILPGVGAYDAAMQKINESSLKPALIEFALVQKKPIMGICLGMQILLEGSDEGQLPGLGWIKGKVLSFKENLSDLDNYKVPHMGWNEVGFKNHPLTKGFEDESRFYFVHSYFAKVKSEENSLFRCSHSLDFDAGVVKGNILGVQFHPEKSHKFGMLLMKNFAEL